MALSYCGSCGSIEGGFTEPDETQLAMLRILHNDESITGDELEDMICDQCGEAGTYTGIPEHDDGEDR